MNAMEETKVKIVKSIPYRSLRKKMVRNTSMDTLNTLVRLQVLKMAYR